jgi:RNA polymerase sigma factor (sigma-70 family)
MDATPVDAYAVLTPEVLALAEVAAVRYGRTADDRERVRSACYYQMVKAARRGFVDDGRGPAPFFATVCHRAARRELYGRHARRWLALASLDVPAVADAVADAAPPASAELAEEVARALRVLPERSRRLVELTYLDELSHQEAAARLGLGRSRVGQIVAASLRAMRRSLERRRNRPLCARLEAHRRRREQLGDPDLPLPALRLLDALARAGGPLHTYELAARTGAAVTSVRVMTSLLVRRGRLVVVGRAGVRGPVVYDLVERRP